MTKIKFLFFLVSAVVTLSPQTFAKLQKIPSKNQKLRIGGLKPELRQPNI